MECGLVGESFDNPDGTSRQEEIARCRRGEHVALRWDRENAHDPAAVAVHSIRGVQIGFLGQGDNREFLSYHADGQVVDATISAIYGGTLEKAMRGVVIDIECTEEERSVENDESGDVEWAGVTGFWLLTHP